MKKLSKIQLKKVNGGEGFACVCGNTFMGFVNTVEGCVYICDKKVIKPSESTDSLD
ncbi:hypothetical protein HZQ19_01835 [Elizabethkingia anophelis]|uniref:hypothetical protein n=1 Tax=Elizabethkingia anophelis TaxID=1117645 RepID=UPI0015E09F1A|nr:hypothetical protein [Elizabethkingia anophelis]MCT3758438.1 hypothetical protein [Elizabethkingia anophelis]MCT3971914.1 hypothetical protein [Elizabethkingia anophelis]MCT4000391.1 hypothetical protein [Elizabethkingia anophelis]MCT4014628.1 hypothetical protein [Elizabethkingia anophelis]MCT4018189.1 hypothetical protein [Elizabethkingia anophelis]